MFTLMPCAVSARIAGNPCFVAGTLTIRFSRSTSRHRRFASAIVPSLSFASEGETSMLTNPSARRVEDRAQHVGGMLDGLDHEAFENSLLRPPVAGHPLDGRVVIGGVADR